MKLSTKGRYGLRALIDLAFYGSNGHQSLGQIAERQNISEIYLEQVFATLRKNGIVKSIKGAQGGYFLNADPDKLSVAEILRILEGDFSIIDQASEEVTNSLTLCINMNVWEKIDEEINEYLDAVTLKRLVEDYKNKLGANAPMYYI
ncbi:RrF2 family transcriptional regulator [Alkalibacter mobilis]|uniref:RrF2 family transcriptional regulator n=1 Tax=Alkalibacter mobilis TaxID=2787712 RepID=UPI0018A006CF|nr:Rrf2 family transcriptional regulator [Alkalibacter mobilis]MBF7096030.1 Rrf2 family transcriptional regulator [Alkalibacter mobilis]